MGRLGLNDKLTPEYKYDSADMPVYASEPHYRHGRLMGYKAGPTKGLADGNWIAIFDNEPPAQRLAELLNELSYFEITLPKS